MNQDFFDTSCIVCHRRHTRTLFICDGCFEATYVPPVHERWLDLAYVEEMRRLERRLDQQAAYKRRAAERKAAA
jgi:hypothetical protein